MKGMQPTWALLVVCLWLAPSFHGEDVLCFHTGNCYMINTREFKFTNANASCGARASLATMKNQQELGEILQLLRPFQDKLSLEVLWIGLYKAPGVCVHRLNELNGFSWIDGGDNTTVNYWAEVPSATCSRKRCVGLQRTPDPTGSVLGTDSWGWKVYPCSKTLASICRSSDPSRFATSTLTLREEVPHPFTDQYTPGLFKEGSKVIVQCKDSAANVTLTCDGANGSYSCINTQCPCAEIPGRGDVSSPKRCPPKEKAWCLQQCLSPGNVTCDYVAGHGLCDSAEAESALNISSSPPPNTANTTQASVQQKEYGQDDDYLDSLIIPLILGIVVLGILVMFIWGGVQMCLRRKKKPQRKKSIVPTEPDGSETDSTDHSSEDEEEDEAGDAQERTEIP